MQSIFNSFSWQAELSNAAWILHTMQFLGTGRGGKRHGIYYDETSSTMAAVNYFKQSGDLSGRLQGD
jgi:hypothetical protein